MPKVQVEILTGFKYEGISYSSGMQVALDSKAPAALGARVKVISKASPKHETKVEPETKEVKEPVKDKQIKKSTTKKEDK